MFSGDVYELFELVPWGTPVVVVNGCFGPFGRGFAAINPGDRGADVLAIQQRLKDFGYFKGNLSGIYEDDLKYALHRFQRNSKLEVQNTITKKDWLAMGFREFE
jgi:peptidoglycan hydrolase-like protein with peptidoglycan-binding domain